MNRNLTVIRIHLGFIATATSFLVGCQSAQVKTNSTNPSNASSQLLSPTQFIEAVQRKDTAQVKLLLANGADPNTRYQSAKELWKKRKSQRSKELPLFHGQTVLMIAARADDIATMKVLIDAKADVNQWGYNSNWNQDISPLMEAIARLSPSAVNLLIKRGADVKAKDSSDTPPLGLAYNLIPSSGEMSPEREKRMNAIMKALRAAGAK